MMDEEARNDFEKSLRESAEDFRVSPSDKVWDGVFAELHGTRRTTLVWWAAAAALVLAVGIWGVYRYDGGRSRVVTARQSTSPDLPRHGAGTVPGEKTAAHPTHETQVQTQAHTPDQGRTLPSTQPTTDSPQPLPGIEASPLGARTAEGASSAVSPGRFPLQAIPFRPEAGFPAGFSVVSDPTLRQEAPFQRTWHAQATADSLLRGAANGHPGGPLTRHRLSWGIYVTPSIGYRTFTSGIHHSDVPPMSMDPSPPGSGAALNFFTYRRSVPITYQQRPEWNWAAGVQVFYALCDQWSLQSGLALTQTGYQARIYDASPAHVNQDGTAQPADAGMPVNSGSMSYGSSAVTPKARDFHIRYLSVELPVMVHRSLRSSGRVSFDLGAGAGLTYLAASRSLIYSPVTGRYFSDARYLRDVNANLHLEAGIVIPATRNLWLTAGPAVQYQVGSSYKGYDQVREHPYFVGLQVGLKWVR